MTSASTIPTPATPDVCTVAILIEGQEISGEYQVLSVSVSRELNRIPSASIQLQDGESAKASAAKRYKGDASGNEARAEWRNTNEIKRVYPTASILGDNRVVFNIKGNKYRLIASINYQKGWLFIKFIGTHAEYNKINAATIEVY